jgi:hypothetical protein
MIGSTEVDMYKMSVIEHISQFLCFDCTFVGHFGWSQIKFLQVG